MWERRNLLMLQLEYTLFDRMIMLELNPETRNWWRRISRKCCPVTGSLKGLLPSPRAYRSPVSQISGYTGCRHAAGWLSVAVLFLNGDRADAVSSIIYTLVIKTIASMTTSRKVRSCFYDFLIGFIRSERRFPHKDFCLEPVHKIGRQRR